MKYLYFGMPLILTAISCRTMDDKSFDQHSLAPSDDTCLTYYSKQDFQGDGDVSCYRQGVQVTKKVSSPMEIKSIAAEPYRSFELCLDSNNTSCQTFKGPQPNLGKYEKFTHTKVHPTAVRRFPVAMDKSVCLTSYSSESFTGSYKYDCLKNGLRYRVNTDRKRPINSIRVDEHTVFELCMTKDPNSCTLFQGPQEKLGTYSSYTYLRVNPLDRCVTYFGEPNYKRPLGYDCFGVYIGGKYVDQQDALPKTPKWQGQVRSFRLSGSLKLQFCDDTLGKGKCATVTSSQATLPKEWEKKIQFFVIDGAIR